MLTRKTDIRARAIGWKPIFLDDHRWQDRRRRVWNADDKSITPSHANRSQVCTPLFWQAFWYVQVRFFFRKTWWKTFLNRQIKATSRRQYRRNLLGFTRVFRNDVRFIGPLFTRYPRDFPISPCSFKNFFDQNSFRFFYFPVLSFHFQRGIFDKRTKHIIIFNNDVIG